MHVAVAHSLDPDLDHAVAELVSELKAQIGEHPPIAMMVFACIEADHARLLGELVAAFPGVPLIGCTTDGEVSQRLRFQEDSIAVTLLAGSGLRARAVVGRQLSRDPDAALDVARALLSDGDSPSLVFVLPEGMSACGADLLVNGLNDRLPAGVPLVGGTAGDQWSFKGTKQFFGDEVLSDSLPLLGIYGDLTVSVGVASGYVPIGAAGLVTRSEGPVVHAIDGLPPIAFYRRVAGVVSGVPPEQPLAVSVDGGAPFLRAPLSVDRETGSIHFAGDVPAGAVVHISEAETDALIAACRTSVESAVGGLGDAPPVAAFVFACAARKQLLGTRTAQEIDVLAGQLPAGVPLSGFYTYGEIGPQPDQPQSDFHNQTFVTVLVGASP